MLAKKIEIKGNRGNLLEVPAFLQNCHIINSQYYALSESFGPEREFYPLRSRMENESFKRIFLNYAKECALQIRPLPQHNFPIRQKFLFLYKGTLRRKGTCI